MCTHCFNEKGKLLGKVWNDDSVGGGYGGCEDDGDSGDGCEDDGDSGGGGEDDGDSGLW